MVLFISQVRLIFLLRCWYEVAENILLEMIEYVCLVWDGNANGEHRHSVNVTSLQLSTISFVSFNNIFDPKLPPMPS